jgi:hypothetical protein
MWQVFVIEGTTKKRVYNGRYMPTVDDMAVCAAVRGKKYQVLSPQGEDVTNHFPYGIET